MADIDRLTLQECLKFLKEVQSVGSHNLSDQSFHLSGGVLNFFTETTATFLKVLLGSIGFYSYDGSNKLHFYSGSNFVKIQVLKSHTDLVTSGLLSEELESLHISIIDSNPRLQNSETTDSPTSTQFPNDVEDKANAIFQEMFHDKISVPSVVQTLIRFSGSSVKR